MRPTIRSLALLLVVTTGGLPLVGCSGDPEPESKPASGAVNPSAAPGDPKPDPEPTPETPTAPPRLPVAERLARVRELAAESDAANEAIPRLLQMVGDRDVEVRQNAEHAIVELAGRTDSYLLEFAFSNDDDSTAMKPIIEKLRDARHPIVVEYGSYSDEDTALRESYHVDGYPAFLLLIEGRVVDQVVGRVTEQRLRSMLDRLPPRRETTADISDETALLVDLLEAGTVDRLTRKRARQALRKRGRAAVEALIGVVGDDTLPDRVRVEAARALDGSADVPDVAAALEAVAVDEECSLELRALAAGAIVDEESALEVTRMLRMVLRDPESRVETRRLAAERLGRTGDAAALPALSLALLDPDSAVVLAAAKSLIAVEAPADELVPLLFNARIRGGYSFGYQIGELLEEVVAELDEVPPSLLAELESGDADRVQLAMSLCREIGDLSKAVPILEAMLEAEEEEEVRLLAAQLLAKVPNSGNRSLELAFDSYIADPESNYQARRVLYEGGQQAVKLLLTKLDDDSFDADKRAATVELIGYMDEGAAAATSKLVTLLEAEHVGLRTSAAIVLARDGNSDDTTRGVLLAGLANGDDEDRRSACADALGYCKTGDDVVAALLKAIDDPSDSVRYNAGDSLGSLARPGDLDELRKRLGEPKKARYVFDALRHLGPKAAPCVDELLELVRNDEDLADGAVYVLAEIGKPAIPALAKLLAPETPGELQIRILQVFSAMGEEAEPATESLVTCLDHEAHGVRVQAASILAQLEHEHESLPGILVDGLAAGDDLSYGCVYGLRTLGEKAAAVAPRLVKLMGSEDPEVAERAVGALQAVGAKSEEAAAAYLAYVVAAERTDEFEERLDGLDAFGATLTPALTAMLDEEEAERRVLAARLLIPITRRLAYEEDDETGIDRLKLRTRLVARLEDEDPHVPPLVAIAVTPLEPVAEKVVPHLVTALDSDEDEVVAAALNAIGNLGSPAVAALPRLLQLVDHEEHGYAAANALEGIEGGVADSIDQIVPLLDDSDTFPVAANLIGSIGEKGAVAIPTLEKGLEDERTIYPAARALVRIGDASKPIVERLVAKLDDETQRYNACRAIGLMGELDPERAETALRESLAGDDFQLRAVAAEGLDNLVLESDETLAVLLAAIDDDNIEVRRAVIDALGQFGEKGAAAVPTLVESLDRERLRYAAISTLSTMGEAAASAMPKLAELLEDDETAGMVMYSLSDFGEVAKPVVPALIEYARRTPDARGYARRLLQEIDPDSADLVPAEDE